MSFDRSFRFSTPNILDAALASHHFPVTAILDASIPQSALQRVSHLHLSTLKDPAAQQRLALDLQAVPASRSGWQPVGYSSLLHFGACNA